MESLQQEKPFNLRDMLVSAIPGAVFVEYMRRSMNQSERMYQVALDLAERAGERPTERLRDRSKLFAKLESLFIGVVNGIGGETITYGTPFIFGFAEELAKDPVKGVIYGTAAIIARSLIYDRSKQFRLKDERKVYEMREALDESF